LKLLAVDVAWITLDTGCSGLANRLAATTKVVDYGFATFAENESVFFHWTLL